jgi:hypothetical protein
MMGVTSNQVHDEAFAAGREAGRQEAIKEVNEWLDKEHAFINRHFNYHNQFMTRALLSLIESIKEKFPVK